MIFDDIDFSKLPSGREEAFTDFVTTINEEYENRIRNDRNAYSDSNDNYFGSYEPERSFVTAILAFLDEYDIDSDIVDISELSNEEFSKHFGKFKSKVEYLTTRFKLRKNRIDAGSIGTLISIEFTYKAEIGKLLNTARKIVNQEIKDTKKRDLIFKKIANLQSEIDRDQTTVDALFGRMLELTQVVGKSAENLDPLMDKLERVKKLFWDNSKKIDLLPKPNRPKQITKEDVSGSGYTDTSDDEIPF